MRAKEEAKGDSQRDSKERDKAIKAKRRNKHKGQGR